MKVVKKFILRKFWVIVFNMALQKLLKHYNMNINFFKQKIIHPFNHPTCVNNFFFYYKAGGAFLTQILSWFFLPRMTIIIFCKTSYLLKKIKVHLKFILDQLVFIIKFDCDLFLTVFTVSFTFFERKYFFY